MSATNDKIRGNWNVIKGKMKQMYGDLTDDDLMYVEGKEDELMAELRREPERQRAICKNSSILYSFLYLPISY